MNWIKKNATLLAGCMFILAAIVVLVTILPGGDSTMQEQPTTEATMPSTEATEPSVDPASLVYDLKEDVHYFGRTYEKDSIQYFNWSASGFSVRFQGSGVVAEIYSNDPDLRNMAYLKIYVDGEEMEDVPLKDTRQTVVLAEGLDPTVAHTVRVLKRTNARSSTAGVGEIRLLDGKILPPEEDKEKLIEFIGDSLTVGYVAAKGGNSANAWSTTTEDATKTYSKQIADAFDADYQVVAISGRGVVRNNGGDTDILFPEIYRSLDLYNNPGVDYDFDKQPDVIVINLGTNDESAANSGLSQTVFKDGLYAFLKEVREKNPNAQIIYAYGLVRTRLSGAIEAVVDQMRSEGDSKIHYLQLKQCEAWELNLNHTVAKAYTSRGEAIIDKIEEITGWKSAE